MKIQLGLFLLLVFVTNSCNQSQDLLEIGGDWRVTHVIYKNKEILGNKLTDNTKWNIPLYKTKLYYIDLASKQWILYLDGEDEKPTRGKFEIAGKKFKDSIKFYNSSDSRFNGLFRVKMEYDTVEEAFKNAFYLMTLKSEEMTIMAVKAKSLPISSKN